MKGALSLILSAICLASLGILRKFIGTELPSDFLTFIRLAVAVIVIYVFFAYKKRTCELAFPKKDWKNLAFIGIALSMAMLLFLESLIYAPVNIVSLIGFAGPVVTSFLAAFFLKEKFTRYSVAAVVLTLVGAMFITDLNFSLENEKFIGVLLMLASVMAGAIYNIGAKYEERKCKLSTVVIWPMIFGTIALLPLALVKIGFIFSASPSVLGLAVLMGIATGVGYFAYDLAMEYMDAHSTSILGRTANSLIAIVLAIAVLGEVITTDTAAGGILLLAAAYIAYKEVKKGEIKHREHHVHAM